MKSYDEITLSDNTECLSAIGLYVSLPDGLREWMAHARTLNAARYADVVIAIGGKEYEFAYDDFLARLGIVDYQSMSTDALVDSLTDQERSALIEQAARRAGLISKEDGASCVNQPTSV